MYFGGRRAVRFAVLSAHTIAAFTPPGSGTVAVKVVTPKGQSSGGPSSDYSYVGLSSVSQARGPSAGGSRVIIKGSGFGHLGTLLFGTKVVTDYTVVSNSQIDATTPPGTGKVVITSLQLGETLADADLGGLGYTYVGRAQVRGQTALAIGPGPTAAQSRPAPHQNRVSRGLADVAGPAPATSPLPWYDEPHQLTFNWGSVIEGGAGALILANALGFSVAASIVGDAAVVAALGAFLPGAVLALAFLVAGALLVDAGLGLASGHSGIFGALIDPSGNVVDTNGNAIAGASVTVLVSPFAAGPFTAVKADSPGIQPRVNPEVADRSGGFHWDVSAGYYEVQASAPGCHAPGSGASTVVSPVFPIPPPKTGLTLVPGLLGGTAGSGADCQFCVPGRRLGAGRDGGDHRRDRVQPLGHSQVRWRSGAVGDLPFARGPHRSCACRLRLPGCPRKHRRGDQPWLCPRPVHLLPTAYGQKAQRGEDTGGRWRRCPHLRH